MQSDMSLTDVSFSFLKSSSEFLTLILKNLSSCVLVLDKELRLQAFNDAMGTIFSSRKGEDLRYVRCGEALGCAYQVEEQVDCGKTTKCCDCDLRIAGLSSYVNNEIVYKDHIVKPFFNKQGHKEDKHLQFSTRIFNFEKEKYIIMIIDDISELMELKSKASS